MSSLRNAVKRITHKERRQPKRREHLGILEKKTDYKERATQYHRKQDRIDRAREAAGLRNPDEFYFGMHNAEVRDGYHRKTERKIRAEREAEIGPAAVKLMKQQDLSHIRWQKQKEQKKIEKLQAGLHFVGVEKNQQGKHTIFVESQEEAASLDLAEHFDTVPELLGQAFHRPRKATLEQEAAEATKDLDMTDEKAMKKRMKKIGRARASKYKELETRMQRVAALERAESHLVTEKLVSQKGKKRKIKAAERGQPAVYKWSSKRQR